MAIFRKNFKNDNFLNGIKNKTRKNKELKYRRKNIVCTALPRFDNFPIKDYDFFIRQILAQKWQSNFFRSISKI